MSNSNAVNGTNQSSIATKEENNRLEHSKGGSTTRSADDLGVPMLSGSPKKKAMPEDALSDKPTRGDYSQRMGESNYQPHEVRQVENAQGQMKTEVLQQSEFNRQIENQNDPASPIETAKAKLERIREKMTDGDLTEAEFKKLKADFQEATDDLEFAELRERATQDRQKKQFESDRRARLSSLQTELATLSDVSSLEKMLPKIADSVEKYISAVSARNAKLSEIRQELQNGGFLEGTLPGQIEGIATSAGRETQIGDTTATHIEPRPALEKVLNESLKKFSARN